VTDPVKGSGEPPAGRRPDWMEQATLRSLEDQAARIGVEVTEEMKADVAKSMVEAAAGELAQRFADEIVGSMYRFLDERKHAQTNFEARLDAIWGKAFDLLEAMIACSIDFAIDFHRAEQAAAAADNDQVFEAVTRLHARACRIALEVLTLMRSGQAMGAMGRFRSLEEIVIVALFIRQEGRDTAERYLRHGVATQWRDTREQNTHSEALGMTPHSDGDLAQRKLIRDRLVAAFDQPCFDLDYGWALTAMGRDCSSAAHRLPRARKHRVTFAEIEKKVDFAQYRPYVRLASRAIHADSAALYWDIGLNNAEHDVMFYGRSNDGFSYPASLTAHFVGLITVCLVLIGQQTADRLMKASGIMKLRDPLTAAIMAAERELAARRTVPAKSEDVGPVTDGMADPSA
jgi:hypothetical protein